MDFISIRKAALLLTLTGCAEVNFTKVVKSNAFTADSSRDGFGGAAGKTCWQAVDHDVNGDGILNVHDCEGPKGIAGLKGLPGKDGTNGLNGTNGSNGSNGRNCFENTGDINGDGNINGLDCRGLPGPAGVNGQNGSPGENGKNCFDELSDQNGDGAVNVEDCRGLPGVPSFSGITTIGCSVGAKIPGGVDPSGLMTAYFPWGNAAFAQCPAGQRLIAAGLVGARLSEGLVPLPPGLGGALIEHGVAFGRVNADDPHLNQIQCFIGNRNPQSCPSGPCVVPVLPKGLHGWGLCVPF